MRPPPRCFRTGTPAANKRWTSEPRDSASSRSVTMRTCKFQVNNSIHKCFICWSDLHPAIESTNKPQLWKNKVCAETMAFLEGIAAAVLARPRTSLTSLIADLIQRLHHRKDKSTPVLPQSCGACMHGPTHKHKCASHLPFKTTNRTCRSNAAATAIVAIDS